MIETSSAPWKPTRLAGVDYLPLHTDRSERAGTFLYRMGPGTSYIRHRHPEGEEIFLLEGEMKVGERILKRGDFLNSPPGTIHEIFSEKGCLFLAVLPKAIEIVPLGTQENEFEEPPTDLLPDETPPAPERK
ncbi:MAG: cupin domain-containing protein [Pseudomonadota bacterium]